MNTSFVNLNAEDVKLVPFAHWSVRSEVAFKGLTDGPGSSHGWQLVGRLIWLQLNPFEIGLL